MLGDWPVILLYSEGAASRPSDILLKGWVRVYLQEAAAMASLGVQGHDVAKRVERRRLGNGGAAVFSFRC